MSLQVYEGTSMLEKRKLPTQRYASLARRAAYIAFAGVTLVATPALANQISWHNGGLSGNVWEDSTPRRWSEFNVLHYQSATRTVQFRADSYGTVSGNDNVWGETFVSPDEEKLECRWLGTGYEGISCESDWLP